MDTILTTTRRNLIYLHEEYKKWKGNSYVNQIVEEMLELPVKNKD